MIQILNKFSMSWLAKGLLLLLVASFVVWGVTDWLAPRMQKDTVAHLGSDSISKEMLYRATRSRLNQLPQEAKESIQKDPQLLAILVSQSLQNLIRDSALKQELSSLGIDISNDFLKEVVFSRPEFQDKSGHFSKTQFDAVLAANRLSERAFLAYEKEHLRALFLQRAIALKEAGVSDAIMEPLRNQLRETRSITLVGVPARIFPLVTKPAEADLKRYYEDNKPDFARLEARDLSIIILTQPRSKRRTTNEEDRESDRDALYEKARSIQDRLAEGESLASIAQAMNLSHASIQGVTSRGTTQDGVVVKDASGLFTQKVLDHAFEFGEGNESDLTPLTEDRYYIVVVDKIIPSVIPSFEEAKEQVTRVLQERERMKKAKQKADQIIKEVKVGENLKAIAQKDHLTVQVLPEVTLFTPTKILSPEALVRAFSLSEKGVDSVLGDKGYQVIQVDSIRANSVLVTNPEYIKTLAALEADFRSDIENSYVHALEESLSLAINEKAFQEVVEAF